jgi:pantoate--beta-alanine ligase
MILFKKSDDLRNHLDVQRKSGEKIGFIPTMGALHPGHISLIERSKEENPLTVCSIFVNPAQFNDPRDFEKYPVTIDKDIYLLEKAGCNLLFLPDISEMYPQKAATAVHYDLGHLETILEGKYRPGHFQGVCKAVNRLLDIVLPDQLYIGQKDYQQCMVIKKLAEIMGVDDQLKIKVCPTLREDDGLAMSSRNTRLNPEERKRATTIFKALCFIKDHLEKGDTVSIKEKAADMLSAENFGIDYVSIADADNLSEVLRWDGKQKLVALVAAFNNEVRLIDNMLLN